MGGYGWLRPPWRDKQGSRKDDKGKTFFIKLTILLWGSSLSGCVGVTGGTVFTSHANLTNAAPVKLLMVLEDVQNGGFDHNMHEGFHVALTSGLTACGVALRILHPDPMDLDLSQYIDANVKEFQPSAMLLINTTGGNIGGRPSTLTYDLKLIDLESNRVTWLAKSNFSIWVSDTDSGGGFGISIVSRLRDDGVLMSCPRLLYQDCEKERRRAYSEASQETDERERKKVIESAPKCN